MMQLWRDAGKRNIIFIRFNPDGYVDTNEKKIMSCWGVNGKGVMALKKTKLKEWVERINVLNNQIQLWIDYPSDKTIEIVQLFY